MTETRGDERELKKIRRSQRKEKRIAGNQWTSIVNKEGPIKIKNIKGSRGKQQNSNEIKEGPKEIKGGQRKSKDSK